MNKEEVINTIGKGNWKEFCKWMYGQTTGITEDGQPDYYSWDVLRFKRNLEYKNDM
jgi:hypothetical protein